MITSTSTLFMHFFQHEHLVWCSISDTDFNSPFVPPGSKPKSGSFVPSEEGVAMVMAMGFSRDQAVKALKNTVSTETFFLNSYRRIVFEIKKNFSRLGCISWCDGKFEWYFDC